MKPKQFNAMVHLMGGLRTGCLKLTYNQKVRLASVIFGTDPGLDNYGQLLFYTGLKYSASGRLRQLTEKDTAK